MAGKNLQVTIAGDPSSLLRAIKAAERGMGDLAKTSGAESRKVESDHEKLNRSFGSIAKSAMGALGAVGLAYEGFHKAHDAIKATDELSKTTTRLTTNLGLTTKQASEWATVAQSWGVDNQRLTVGFTALSKASEAATAGSKKQAQAFKDLGITQADLKRGQTDFNFLLGKVADGLSNVHGGTSRVAVASTLLGKSYAPLMPLLGAGSKALKEQTDLADKYGATLSGKTNRSLLEMRASQREMKIAQLGLKVQITNEILPTWIKFEEATLKVAKAFAGPGSLDEKIKRVGKTIGPVIQDVKAEILNDIPKIANEVGRAAPKVAGAFVKGFEQADVWGKLAIGAFLLKRFGGLGAALTLGKSIGAKLGAGIAAGEATGAAAGAGAGVGVAAGASRLPVIGGAIAAGAVLYDQAIAHPSDVHDVEKRAINATTRALAEKAAQIKATSRTQDEYQRRIMDLAAQEKNAKTPSDQLNATVRQMGIELERTAIKSRGMDQVNKYLMRLGPTAKQVNASFDSIEKNTGSVMDNVQQNVSANIDRIRKDLGTKSQQGKQALAANFGGAADAITRAMQAGTVSTSKGLGEIHSLMSSALKTYGISTAQLAHYFSQTNFAAGINAGILAGPVQPAGKAGGGWIGGRGQAGHDTVPTMLGVGEAVLNRHQQAPVEAALRSTYGMGLNDLFARVQRPHYMASGGFAGVGVVGGGVVGQVADRGLRAEQGILGQALTAIRSSVSSAASGVVGPAGGPKGLATFGGVTMAKWIANELSWATAHGWRGQPTSGYRPGFDPHTATGASEHQGTQYPHGAVDFGGFVDPAAKATKMALLSLADRLNYPGPRLIAPIGFSDDGHLSGTGHTAGGWARMASGGFVQGKISTFGPPGEAAGPTAYGGSSAQAGIAVNPGGTPTSWNAPEALALRGKRMRVTVAGHTAILPVIDKGPSAAGRKIDITGAGVAALGIPYRSFPTDAIGTAQVVDGSGSIAPSGGSGHGGGGDMSSADLATHNAAVARKQTSRLLNSIIHPAMAGTGSHVGITALGRRAAGFATRITDADANYGRLQRQQGQTDEDLGTEGGRGKRISEIDALRDAKGVQLARERRELAALLQQAAKLQVLIKRLRGTLVGKHRVKGVQAARVRQRIRGFESDLTDVQAAIKALGGDIQDTVLDLGDLDRERAQVAVTPNTVAAGGDQSGGGPSVGDTGASSAASDQAAAQQALAAALASLQAEIKRQNDFAESVTAKTGLEVSRALADLMNGQIVGYGLRGRNATAGAGAVVRM